MEEKQQMDGWTSFNKFLNYKFIFSPLPFVNVKYFILPHLKTNMRKSATEGNSWSLTSKFNSSLFASL